MKSLRESFYIDKSKNLRGVSRHIEPATSGDFYSLDMLKKSVQMRQRIHPDEVKGFERLFNAISKRFYLDNKRRLDLSLRYMNSKGITKEVAQEVCEWINRRFLMLDYLIFAEDNPKFEPFVSRYKESHEKSKYSAILETGRNSEVVLEFIGYDLFNFDIVATIRTNKSDDFGKYEEIVKTLSYNYSN